MRTTWPICLLVFAQLLACTSPQFHRSPAAVDAAPVLPRGPIPNSEALLSWQDKVGFRSTDIDPSTLAHVALKCADQNLYPTYPQEAGKLYHIFKYATYDQSQLKADDETCRLAAKTPNSHGVRACLQGDQLNFTIMSDTFMDSCGHNYRGLWEVLFLASDDSMGMLFSRGRTMYPKPNSEFNNDMVDGPTYAVPLSDFLFLTEIFNGDLEKIELLKAQSRRTHHFDQEKKIFIPNN